MAPATSRPNLQSVFSLCGHFNLTPITWNQWVLCLCRCTFPLFIQAVKLLSMSLKTITEFAWKAEVDWSTWPVFLSHPSCERWVIRTNNMALIIFNPAKPATERGRGGERETEGGGGGGRVYPERGQTSFQRPPSTHTPGTVTLPLWARPQNTNPPD